MNGLLQVVLTLLAINTAVVRSCSTFTRQINLTICNWQEVRASVVRDTIYLDGGHLWYQQGFDDGCVSQIDNDGASGYFYNFNLSTPFNTTSNFTSLIGNSTKASGFGNLAPNYIDGAMLANANEFYLYGGFLDSMTGTSSPAGNLVLSYEAHDSGTPRDAFKPTWNTETLPSNVTRYITNGASASVPSENKGFYFSGMRASGWGEFDLSYDAQVLADSLITVDMSSLGNGKWTNTTLPPYVPSRANAELVWVPVSDSGVLVAIGGVIQPAEFWSDTGLNSSQQDDSKRVSPSFMETLSIYDVQTGKWYLQNTTGETPPQLTQFCSVLASADDGSSHNIYIYGGYSGLDDTEIPSDDVYILSLPSFKWFRAYNGTQTHGRSGHRCFQVYPDQMLAIGGYRTASTQCLEDGVIVNFNLNTLSFEEKYDPAGSYSSFKVPDIITKEIGGSSSGGATVHGPQTWTNKTLGNIFGAKYTKSIKTYYPYNTTTTDTSTSKGGGFPKWAAAVIGVLCGLLVVGLLVGLWFFYRRRRQQREKAIENSKELDNTDQTNLMYAPGPTSPGPGPHSTSTGMDTGANISTGANNSIMGASFGTGVTPLSVESGGGAVHEIPDSSPAELPTEYNSGAIVSTQISSPGSPSNGFPSPVSPPISPQSLTESESGQSVNRGHHRSTSTRSTVPSLSIDNVVTTTRASHFRESFDGNMQRARHGSEISEASVSSDERGPFNGSETIHE